MRYRIKNVSLGNLDFQQPLRISMTECFHLFPGEELSLLYLFQKLHAFVVPREGIIDTVHDLVHRR